MGKISSRRIFFITITVVFWAFLSVVSAHAQSSPIATPSFWDPALRPERPDLSGLRAIRFLTDDNYPPLNFTLDDGTLTGFNVDIARAVCEELELGCTIQARRWDTLIDSLETGKGDAVIASITATVGIRTRVDFSQPYYQSPARFIVRRGTAISDARPSTLNGKKVGVVADSAHAAYLKTFFPGTEPKYFPSVSTLQVALRDGAIEAAFGDGLTFAVWLHGASSANCCVFLGGPFFESRFFGEGVGIAVRKEDADLRRVLDWALARLAARGAYAEIYLKYFPVSFY